MADEQGILATTSQASMAQGDTTQPLATETQQPQQSQKNTAIDLEKELQKIRSQAGRETAEAKRAADAALREANALRQQMREQRLANMDEVERPAFLANEAQQYAANLERQLAQERNDRQRERDIDKLVAKYGAPREVFEAAADYADAVEKGEAYRESSLEERIAAEVEKRTRKIEANAPDLGGGKASTPSARQDDRLRDSFRNKDATSYVLEILKSRS